ncbi:DUF3307 domain-containing protein [Rhizobium phage RHph_I1_18]|nr:DUF3307 domain-containing protein [Rhizobium phage RHph_I1_18]
MISEYYLMIFALMIGHAIADYPGQGDFMARGKNCKEPIPGVPWYTVLFNHSLIHAGFVWVITTSPILALCELTAHFAIDYGKCRFKLSFNLDQMLHLACKVLWAFIAVYMLKQTILGM